MENKAIKKNTKLDRVTDRLTAAMGRLEDAIDVKLGANAQRTDQNELRAELQRLTEENQALRDQVAQQSGDPQVDRLSAENRELRRANAEATDRIDKTIMTLQQALQD